VIFYFLFITESEKKKIVITIYRKILSSISVININNNNNNIAANQHIRMISQGSCDTEDWSNDAENSVLHQRNKLHF